MVLPASPVLESFEDLGSLFTSEKGMYEVKPFYDWINTPWKDKIFKMRLCNAGEVLDIQSYISKFPEIARLQALKLEILIRAIHTIDNRELLTAEELQKYNETNNQTYTREDYLRLWIHNLEQNIVDRLDSIYANLQLKQLRLLQNLSLCIGCGQTYSEWPTGYKKLKYSVAEILCSECLNKFTKEQLSIYDFEESKTESTVSENKEKPVPQERSFDSLNYICDICQKEFDTLEEFTTHRETCNKTQDSILHT